MSDLIKALTDAGRASLDLIAALLVIIGGLLVFGGGTYRVFVRPEWTFEQAASTLWPVFLAGVVIVVLGWLVDRSAAQDRR
jgi:F0F1-type ATP synthase assembly protein I